MLTVLVGQHPLLRPGRFRLLSLQDDLQGLICQALRLGLLCSLLRQPLLLLNQFLGGSEQLALLVPGRTCVLQDLLADILVIVPSAIAGVLVIAELVKYTGARKRGIVERRRVRLVFDVEAARVARKGLIRWRFVLRPRDRDVLACNVAGMSWKRRERSALKVGRSASEVLDNHITLATGRLIFEAVDEPNGGERYG